MAARNYGSTTNPDLLADGPERPPGEDQHVEAVNPQLALLADQVGVHVLDEDLPLEQVMVADRLGIVQQPALKVDRTFGNQGRLDSLGRQRGRPRHGELVADVPPRDLAARQHLVQDRRGREVDDELPTLAKKPV